MNILASLKNGKNNPLLLKNNGQEVDEEPDFRDFSAALSSQFDWHVNKNAREMPKSK
jgi:hypothetical protein